MAAPGERTTMLVFDSTGAGAGDPLSECLLKSACLCHLGAGIPEGSQEPELLPSGDVVVGL